MSNWYHYRSITKSGKIIGVLGELDDLIRITDILVKESPWYDPNDPIIIEKVTYDDKCGNTIVVETIKEY